MTKFIEVPCGDVIWFGVRLSNGHTLLLYPSHWKGDTHRPGQRLVR